MDRLAVRHPSASGRPTGRPARSGRGQDGAQRPPGLPSRPPELFGVVEDVRPLNQGTPFLLRSTRPNLAGWHSPQNEHHLKNGPLCVIIRREGLPIHRRGGGAAELKPGQTVSVWCSEPMYASDPPGWCADAVVIEPADR